MLSLTYQQSVSKRYHSDKRFSVLPTRWRQKSTGIEMAQNYVTVTVCIHTTVSERTLRRFYELNRISLTR